MFAEKGDLLLLGARTLEGLNLVVNSRDKKLVAAGPIPAAWMFRTGFLVWQHRQGLPFALYLLALRAAYWENSHEPESA